MLSLKPFLRGSSFELEYSVTVQLQILLQFYAKGLVAAYAA